MSNNTPLFTICIPVFNSEKYIEYPISDLVNQTFGDYECLVIDDRSPDGAIRVVEKIIKDDHRFIIQKNQSNLGVSNTRNIGLERAKGEYIIFLDSDDRYDTRLLESIAGSIRAAEQKGVSLDVITWELGNVGADHEKIKHIELWRENELSHYKKPTDIYDPSRVADRIFQINVNSMCAKCFRVDHLKKKGIRFDNHIKFGEDAFFSYLAILSAKNIFAIPHNNILYYYRRDQFDSAMHTIDICDQVSDQIAIIEKVNTFLREQELYGLYGDSFKKWASDGVGSIMNRINIMYQQKSSLVEQEMSQIYTSRSWRLTSPLRAISGRRGLRAK